MEEAIFSFTSALWRELSALLVISIGVLSLRGGRARPRGAFAFGLFAVAWGLQIAFGNAMTFAAPEATRVLFLLFVACSLPATYLLADFAATQSMTAGAIRWRLVRLVAATIALGTAAVLVLQPSLILESVSGARGSPVIQRGPLFIPLVVAPQFAAFGIALVALFRTKQRSPTPRTALRASTMLAGLGIYVGYVSGFTVTYDSIRWLAYGNAQSRLLSTIFAVLAVLIIALAAVTLREAGRARTPQEGRRNLMLAAALGVPLVWGAVEALLFIGPFPRFSTLGLWRVVGLALIGYGLAQWRLPDLPQRTARAAATSAGASAAAGGGIAIYGIASLLGAGAALPLAAALVTFSAGLFPGVRLARRLFERSTRGGPVDEEGLYGQRVDAYRAALESSLARGTLEEDADFLGALRERFGITDSEDRLLRHYARACILAPREGDASAAYERLRLLGEGGAGRTWLARDRVRDRLVVLKEPLERWQREPTLREAVLREARLAARVRHPNVIRVEEVIEHRGAPIIVMEFAEGGSLADLLRRRGVLPWRDALQLAIPILRGVEAIHQGGIVHRDVKPSNVLLTLEGEPKIADFGIAVAARSLDAPQAKDRTVVDGTTFVGTYAYLAPEVRAGSPGDKRSDVYACAAILHEALYGSPPGLQRPVLAANEVPAELTRVLARALAADPAQRPATARALAEELTNTLARPARL